MPKFNEERYVPGHNLPGHITTAHVITSLRLVTRGGHTTIKVFNRGGYAGELVVDNNDASEIACRLLPQCEVVEIPG